MFYIKDRLGQIVPLTGVLSVHKFKGTLSSKASYKISISNIWNGESNHILVSYATEEEALQTMLNIEEAIRRGDHLYKL